jgi:hypothetical protein
VASQTPDVGLIRTGQRLTTLFGFYVFALFMVIAFLTGSLTVALFMIVVAETVIYFWRPAPALGPASYSGPTPAGWQTPIRLMRGYELVSGCWSLAAGAVLVTVIFGAIFIGGSPWALGRASYTVGVIVAGWLLTRPLWYRPLRALLDQSLKGVKKEMSKGAASVLIGADGLDIVQHVTTIGGPPRGPWNFHINFAEIDELRMLDAMDAQAYWQTMQTYDPTLSARQAFELYQYLQGKLPRPSIYQNISAGQHLLIRSPSVLYLLAWEDESGPLAIAAWQAWRATHGTPATPSA